MELTETLPTLIFMKNHEASPGLKHYAVLISGLHNKSIPAKKHLPLAQPPNKETMLLPAHIEHVSSVIENEKCKLGQELHDGVNPLLSAALLYLSLSKPVSKRGRAANETIHAILMEAIVYIRNLASDLVVLEKEQYTLKDLVEGYIDRIKSVVSFSITTVFENCGSTNEISHHEKTNLYRIVQEQINNIIKYSKANQVYINVKNEQNGLTLVIEDNGVGFDTSLKKNGIGLMNMKRRIDELHGSFKIKSSPGKGCAISILLPFHEGNNSGTYYSY